ncbi:hypothetical protein [Pseudonocardia acidicola]|uniref:Uncharacterized protein n=1 Tax=Pseudonocardia acidicola TaxID=2724939 RepID=A0ABX1SI39_9PSEU|nr:hypothetical protein [Pseudonocardia acidicola]NMI00726.1 hypothetical protein [Pseudonocardia acidicola]
MADRRVSVRLEADTRAFQTAVNKAADQVDDLARKTERVDGKNIRARVTVDGAAEASAEVDGVRRAAEGLDGKHYKSRVSVDVRQSSRDISILANSISALGPAAIGAAGVAVGALGGLGATVGTVAVAAGVGVAALSGVGDALKALDAAAQDPSEGNLRKAREALQNLTLAGRHFALFVDGEMRPALRRLRDIAQANMLPGLQQGLEGLLGVLPQVENLVGKTAGALGKLAAEAGDALDAPFWRSYVNFLAQEAGPIISGFGHSIGNLIEGFAGMQMAFSPLARDMISGLESLTARFAQWGTTVGSTEGFREFIQWVRETGPQVMSTLGALAGTLGEVATAAAPLAGPTLTVLRGLADGLSAIVSIPGLGTTLLGAASAIGAINLALRTSDAVRHSRLATTLGNVAEGGGKMATTAGRAAGALDKIGRSIPVVGAAIVGLGLAVEAGTADIDGWSDALLSGSMSIEQLRQKVDEHNSSFWRWQTPWDDGKISMEEFRAELEKNIAELPPLQQASARATVAQADFNDAVDEFGAGSVEAADAHRRLTDLTNEEEDARRRTADATRDQAGALRDLQDEQLAAASADLGLRQALLSREEAQDRATEATKKHGAGSREARDANLALEQADLAVIAASDKLSEANLVNASAADQSRLAAFSHTNTLLGLASGIYGQASPAIIEMAAQMSDSELAAWNADVKTQGFDSTVRKLPDGRTVRIVTDDAVRERENTAALIEKLNQLPLLKDIKVRASGEWSAGTYILGDGTVGGGARNSAGGTFQSPGISHADGGILPGFTPGRDVHTFAGPAGTLHLSGGEAIMRPEYTAAMGRGYIDRMNAAARSGGVSGVRRAAGSQAFAAGGVYGSDRFPQMVTDLDRELTDRVAKRFAAQMRSGVASAAAGGAPAGAGPAVAQVQAVASRYGWGSGPEWAALSRLIQKESSWNPNAANPRSSARGLFQKMTSIHGPVEPTPAGQAEWGLGYIRNRYGSPSGALAFHLRNNWYDAGGIADGRGVMAKATLAPERVLSPRQTAAFERLVDVISRPRPVSGGTANVAEAMRSAIRGAIRDGDLGKTINIMPNAENTIRETVDFHLLMQQMEFAARSAGF